MSYPYNNTVYFASYEWKEQSFILYNVFLTCYCKVERYKSPDIVKIPGKLIIARSETLHSEIHNLMNSLYISSKGELTQL
jgi:hypothetical protein